jgi:hypothetical protein
MKTKPVMDPTAAFPDARHQPGDADLKVALGTAAASLETVVANLRATQPAVTVAWQYSDQSGWYHLLLLKKRRLLYLMPKLGDFRMMMILGGKALAELKAGPHGRQTLKLLKTAKRYPEGTAFTFTHETLDPGLLAAFLAAKIAH